MNTGSTAASTTSFEKIEYGVHVLQSVKYYLNIASKIYIYHARYSLQHLCVSLSDQTLQPMSSQPPHGCQ